MESQFGHDFARVRIHTAANAASSAEQLQARAYTVGDDIVFRSGAYAPGTRTGQKLLAHELTHVVQQRASSGAVQRDAVNSAGPMTVIRDPVPGAAVDSVSGSGRACDSGGP